MKRFTKISVLLTIAFTGILLLQVIFMSGLPIVLAHDTSNPSIATGHNNLRTSLSLSDGNETNTGDNFNHTDINTEVEHSSERNVNIQVDNESKQIQLESELRNNMSKNRIEFQLQAENSLQIEMNFKSETATNHSELGMAIEFRKVVEFIDNTSNSNNTVNGLDSTDKVVNSFDFGSINWSFDYTNKSVNNQTLYTISVTGMKDGATFQFVFYFATSFVQLDNNTILQPTAGKFDFNIKNYSYNTSTSQLALETKFKSELESRNINHDTEDEHYNLTKLQESGINFGNSSYTGFFSWADQVNVDGVNSPVVISPVMNDDAEGAGQTKMYFSFAHGNNISWDPKVGVSMSTAGIPLAISTTESSLIISSPMTTNLGKSTTPGFEVFTLLSMTLLVGIVVNKRKTRK
ncbi:MAG: hypothetical protein ACFFD1_14345 [Candidatus Thorarchaeota archaeon]